MAGETMVAETMSLTERFARGDCVHNFVEKGVVAGPPDDGHSVLVAWRSGEMRFIDAGLLVRRDFEFGVDKVPDEDSSLREAVEQICQERATSPITRARLRHALAGVDWRKAK